PPPGVAYPDADEGLVLRRRGDLQVEPVVPLILLDDRDRSSTLRRNLENFVGIADVELKESSVGMGIRIVAFPGVVDLRVLDRQLTPGLIAMLIAVVVHAGAGDDGDSRYHDSDDCLLHQLCH